MRLSLFISLVLTVAVAKAQVAVPGKIIRAATPAANPMNPNGDAFITTTGVAFTGPLDETQFEVPFSPITQYEAEPGDDNDIKESTGCDNYEMVEDAARGANTAYYYTADPDGIRNNGDELVLFRFRVARWDNGSAAFSILIDTDNRFGFTGPTRDPNAVAGNPGFELEVVLIKTSDVAAGIKVSYCSFNASTGLAVVALNDCIPTVSSAIIEIRKAAFRKSTGVTSMWKAKPDSHFDAA